MSGIYFTVWDDDRKDESVVLRPTTSGWPHLTLAYTGKILGRPDLVKIAVNCFDTWALKSIAIVAASVSSWETSPGQIRHDVLLEIADVDAEAIERTRDTYLKCYAYWEQFTMRKPHITHSTHMLLKDAEAEAKLLNDIYLPYRVAVTGVTIGSKAQ